MNKTVLIAGGASVASLAIGAAGGYLYTRRQFFAQVELLVEVESAKTKKHYEQLLTRAHDKIEELENTVAIMVALGDDTTEDESLELEGEESVEEESATNEIMREAANTALVDYSGKSTRLIEQKPALDSLVASNIFDKAGKGKKQLPPRGAGGKFLPKQTTEATTEVSGPRDPYLITHEEFLLNDLEYDQENLRYFKHDDTLLDSGEEVVDNDRVGQENLAKFPTNVPGDQDNIICVRNEGLGIDYEIRLSYESLTAYMGFGDGDESDFDESAYI